MTFNANVREQLNTSNKGSQLNATQADSVVDLIQKAGAARAVQLGVGYPISEHAATSVLRAVEMTLAEMDYRP